VQRISSRLITTTVIRPTDQFEELFEMFWPHVDGRVSQPQRHVGSINGFQNDGHWSLVTQTIMHKLHSHQFVDISSHGATTWSRRCCFRWTHIVAEAVRNDEYHKIRLHAHNQERKAEFPPNATHAACTQYNGRNATDLAKLTQRLLYPCLLAVVPASSAAFVPYFLACVALHRNSA